MQTPNPAVAVAPVGEYLLETLADHVAGARDRALSAQESTRAAVCVLHAIHCAVSGRDLPWSQKASAILPAETGGSTVATLWGLRRQATTEDAVFVNASHAQSTMGEDMHAPSLTHPGSIVVPVALGLGEELDADGDTIITAVAAGYDVMCKLGAALKTPEFVARGFRPSGVFGPLGAAAAAAVLLGLDRDKTMSALGIAANTSAGLREWAHRGSTDIFFHNGFAARNGLTAARLAAVGVTGPSSAIEGAAGMNVAFSGNTGRVEQVPSALRTESAVGEVYFKRYQACGAVQTVVRLVSNLRREHNLRAEDVVAVTVRTHHHGKDNPGCDNPGPWSSTPQAQMSNQMGVALALLVDSPTLADYADFESPTVLDVARRVRIVEEPRCSAIYPAESRAEVDIELIGGRTITDDLTGVSPLSDDEVSEVAAQTLRPLLGDAAGPFVADLLSMGTGASIRQLLAPMH